MEVHIDHWSMAGRMTTAVVVTWAGTGRCDSSQCLCYITNSHQASGNNSPVYVVPREIYLSGQKEEEGVEAMGVGEEAWPAAGTK